MSQPQTEVNPPQQNRSRESYERLLNTGAEVLRESGLSGFTLQAVSQRAGVGVGSIYLRVAGRDALILAIHEREMKRLSDEETAVIDSVLMQKLEPVAHVHALILAIGELTLHNADILAVFMTLGPSDNEIFARAREHAHIFGARFRMALAPIRERIAHPDPDLAIDITYRVVYDTIARRISRGPSFVSERGVGDDVLLGELSRIAELYLFTA